MRDKLSGGEKGDQTVIKEAITKVVNKEDLNEVEMMQVMSEVMGGKATPAQIASFITALRMKGETVEEVTGAARIMRQKATRIDARSTIIVDPVGTGGDGMNSFNISTTTAFVVAAAGITVAKHGNRAVSSGCGSADCLEALGVNISAEPEIVEECIQQIGIGFLFAPRLHGAMKYAIGPRKEIAIRTIFNMLGPLTNPAGATAQLIGVYDPTLTEMFAGVLKNLGTKRAFVVHGSDGLDEATVTGETRVTELKDDLISTYNINPIDIFGETYRDEELIGGDPPINAQITKDVLSGKDGARRKIVLLNAALAIMAGEKAANIKEGIAIAEECIDSGAAIKKLQALIELSNS
jgi:anthranilate phosphoribosyltransferase